MSRSRNSDDFLTVFRDARREFEFRHEPQLGRLRELYTAMPGLEEDVIEEALEAHVRKYVIDRMLQGLNWNLEPAPGQEHNLLVESPVKSLQRGTTRYLDYLGIDTADETKPILIVEAKRPGSAPPTHAMAARQTRGRTPNHVAALVDGLSGKPLSGQWNSWIKSLRDYVQSVHKRVGRCVNRAVLTNGDWLVIFLYPFQTFIEQQISSDDILVFESRNDVEDRAGEVFWALEHQHVVGELRALNISEVGAFISPSAVHKAILAVRVLYQEQAGFFADRPIISVLPLVFLGTRSGTWIEVAAEQSRSIPHKNAEIEQHYNDIALISTELQTRIDAVLGTTLAPISINAHYADAERDGNPLTPPGFVALRYGRPGVDQYVVLTGNERHFFRMQPSRMDCLNHSVAALPPLDNRPAVILDRSTSPRSFFVDGEQQHCAHPDIRNSKAIEMTDENSYLCGPRSGRPSESFCEIYRLERYLCCRACVFEDVCVGRRVFVAPCRTPEMPLVPDGNLRN